MQFENNDNYLGSVRLTDITRQFGTPVYMYDAVTMTDQFKRLQKAFSSINVKIKYACKALINVSVLKHFKILERNSMQF